MEGGVRRRNPGHRVLTQLHEQKCGHFPRWETAPRESHGICYEERRWYDPYDTRSATALINSLYC
jgi:hypothetical protein